jgi:hypothetical protein
MSLPATSATIPADHSEQELPLRADISDDPRIQGALRAYLAAPGRLAAPSTDLMALAMKYDVSRITSAIAVRGWMDCAAPLLASHLDNHTHVLVLPGRLSDLVYPFLLEFPQLSLWERLVAFPAYAQTQAGAAGFFPHDAPLVPARYYAALRTLFAIYSERYENWLNARARFLPFLQVAYALALGRNPGTPRPLIVCNQPEHGEELRRAFFQDFPQAQCLHLVRDPLAALDALFDQRLRAGPAGAVHGSAAVAALRDLLNGARAHPGTESRARAMRLEELERAPAATMRRLADWLRIPDQPTLAVRTDAGRPMAGSDAGHPGTESSAARARVARHLRASDRALLLALLHEDLNRWRYPGRRAFRRGWLRVLAVGVLLWVPTQLEAAVLRRALREEVWRPLRSGHLGQAARAAWQVVPQRLQIIELIGALAMRRLRGEDTPLRVI